MNTYDAIELLHNSYKTAYKKAKEALTLSAAKGQLLDHLREEHDRLLEDLKLFDPETSPLIMNGGRRQTVEAELRKVASKMSKGKLVEISVAQEIDIWNLEQLLQFTTKIKKLDNKTRLDRKASDYENSQSRNKSRKQKFSGNDAILMKILIVLLNELGKDPIPTDYRIFKIRAEKTKPEFIPKPRESDEDKLLTEEDRAHELGRKSRETWSDSTLRAFWEKHTKVKPSTKKVSSSKS